MAERSHFLAILDQVGWRQAEMAPAKGAARAFLNKTGEDIAIEIMEGGHLLARMKGKGPGARQILTSLAVSEGAYFEVHGQEKAWARALEVLFSMRASTMSIDAPANDAAAGLSAMLAVKKTSPAEKS